MLIIRCPSSPDASGRADGEADAQGEAGHPGAGHPRAVGDVRLRAVGDISTCLMCAVIDQGVEIAGRRTGGGNEGGRPAPVMGGAEPSNHDLDPSTGRGGGRRATLKCPILIDIQG